MNMNAASPLQVGMHGRSGQGQVKIRRSGLKRSYVADCEDPDGEGEDDEDLEAEEVMNEVLVEDQANEDAKELTPIEEGLDEGLDEEDPEELEEQIMEAYAAGQKAKIKMHEKRRGEDGRKEETVQVPVYRHPWLRRSRPLTVPVVAKRDIGEELLNVNVLSRKDRPHQKKTGKRGWTVVSRGEDEDQVPSSESSRPEEKPKIYHLRKGPLKEAAGYEVTKTTKEK
ncbi:unnamed protein product, partial [Durusdinium trenchii]